MIGICYREVCEIRWRKAEKEMERTSGESKLSLNAQRTHLNSLLLSFYRRKSHSLVDYTCN